MTPSAAVLTAQERARFLDLVDQRFGIRGSDYGASRIDDAVAKVLPRSSCTTPAELLDSLDDSDNPRWLYELVEHLTVGETYFLRDAAQVAAMREAVLLEIAERRKSERRMRLWSAGCSTGEEVYSLAMLLAESKLFEGWDVTLVGTDVNRESLRAAREASYPAWSFRTTPDSVRDRYFQPIETGWRVVEPIREMARFAWMNLGAEQLMPPSNECDLILCRNVTIYFDDAATQRLYRALIGALTPGGWLVLGPSDPLPTDRRWLERVELTDAVLWRRVATPKVAEPPRTPTRTVLAVRQLPAPTLVPGPHGDERAEMEAGLLALEAGSAASAVEWLRRATFRDPTSPVSQFALARAYIATGDVVRAHAALVHTDRLLGGLDDEGFVPGGDSLPVATLRQTVKTYLDSLAA